jgi:glutaminyl-peptide cyclotransferase
MRTLTVAIALIACGCGGTASRGGVPEYGYEIVHAYPHDPEAFTEGLFYQDGFLYESTGLEGQSSIRKVKPETGEVVQRHELPPQYFGEGIVRWKDKLIQLTYKAQVGFVFDAAGFNLLREFNYPGEGWAMTHDGRRILMSDGTPQIRFWDPETLREQGRLTVSENGAPLPNVNELEWIEGEVWANVWLTDRIVRIDPASGAVVGSIDLSGLLSAADRATHQPDVLNGIAYDAQGKRVFVTGKKWPKLFEIRVVKKAAR